MMKWKSTVAMLIMGVMVVSSNSIYASAEENTKQGQAGIDFEEGGTVIDPGPDEELPDIKSGSIYFGEQELNADTMTYNSVNSHTQEDLQYAGFVVKAGNANGWSVTAQISGFKLNNEDITMKNFTLELKPEEVVTTSGNLGVKPEAKKVKLSAHIDGSSYGESVEIFVAGNGEGFGKWGCNWQGDLTVLGGSVAEAGEASAIMLWTLNPGQVII